MKICPTCKRDYPYEYNVCPLDGGQLEWSVPNTGVAAGQPAMQAPPPPLVPGQQPRRGVPAWAWVLIAFGVLLFVVVPVLLMLIAIPTIGSMKKKANDISAIQSVHLINSAQLMYEANYPENGFACSLAALGGDPGSSAPSASAAQVIPPPLASGTRSGYVFTITRCTKVTVNGSDRIVGYTVTAVPQTPGRTGDRGFCSDETGALKFDPTGGTYCTQSIPE